MNLCRSALLYGVLIGTTACNIKGAIEELSGGIDSAMSKIEATGNPASLIADNQYHEAVKVTLFTTLSAPKEGTAVQLEVQGDGTNDYQCGTSNSNGEAICSIATDRPGIKLIRLKGIQIRNIVAVTFYDSTSSATPVDSNGNPVSGTPVLVGNGQATTTIAVNMTDANGQPISGAMPILQVSGGSGNAQVTCQPSNSSGVALCTITDNVSGVSGTVPPITVNYVYPPLQNSTTIAVAPPDIVPTDSRGTTGSTTDGASVSINLTDSSGNPIVGQVPTLNIQPPAGVSYTCTASNSNGVSTCTITSTTDGAKSIAVTSPSGITETVSVNFGTPAPYVAPITAPANGTSPLAITVPLVDGSGNPVVGQVPTLNIQPPNSSYTCTASDSSGNATCYITSGTSGTQTVTASAPGAVTSTQTVTFTEPATPTYTAPSTGADAVMVPIALVDSNGNPIVGQTPVLNIDPPNGTSYVCSPSDSSGISNCYITSTNAGTKTITVTSPSGVASSATVEFTSPSTPPDTSASATGHDGVTITMDLVDGSGNPIVGQVPVLNINPPNGTTYECTPSNSSGQSFCTIYSSSSGTKSITVSSPAGVTDTASVSFTDPNATVSSEPAGTPIVAPVMLVDSSGNPIVGQTPTLNISPAGATYSCTPTDSSGLSYCTVNSTSQGTFTATVTNAGAVSDSFTATFTEPASPVEVPSSPAPADGSTAQVITVHMTDANGNPIAGAVPEGYVTGGGTNSMVCDPSDASGVAKCYVTSNTAGQKEVYFNNPYMSEPVTVDFSSSNVAIVSNNVPANGSSQAVFIVTTKDANGNIITGVVPTATTTGDASVTCTPSNSSGISTCAVTSSTAGTYDVAITEPPGSAQTVKVSFTDAYSSWTVSVAQANANNTDTAEVRVTLMASEYMPKVGETPTLVISGGGTSYTCSSSNIMGVSVCTIKSTKWGDKTIRVSSPALNGTKQVKFLDPFSNFTEVTTGSGTSYESQTTLPVRLYVNVRDHANNPKADVLPKVQILNPNGANITSNCLASNSSGQALCEFTSDVAGDYDVKLSEPYSIAQTQIHFLIKSRSCTVANGAGMETWTGPNFNDWSTCGSIACSTGWYWDGTQCKEDNPPTGGDFAINSGSTYTGSQSVTLDITCATDPSPPVQVTYAEGDPNINTGWVACTNGNQPLNLSAGTGTKTVYMRFRDKWGNIATVNHSIYLDQDSPTGAAVSVDNTTAGAVASPNITISVTCPTDPSGTVQMAFGASPNPNSGWTNCVSNVPYVLSNGDGAKTIYFRFRDGAGNVTASDVVANVNLDTTGPTSNLSYMNGWLNNTLNFNVTVSGTDSYSAVENCDLEVSMAPLSFGNVGSFGGWSVLNPPSGNGCGVRSFTGQQGKAFRFQVHSNDVLGNIGPYFLGTQIVKIDMTPPTGGSITVPAQETSLTIPISVDRGNDPESGMSALDSGYGIEVRSAGYSNGSCSSFGSWDASGITVTATGTTYNFIGVNGTCYEFRYTTTNQSGLSSQYVSMNMVKVDTTSPVGGSVVGPTPYVNSSTTFNVTVDRGSDPESGMSNLATDYKFEVSQAVLTADTCGAFSSFTDAGLAVSPAATSYSYPGAQSMCYKFRYTVTNGLGLTTTYTSATTTKVDITPPVGGAIAVAARSTTNSFPVTVTLGNDPNSDMDTTNAGYRIDVRSAPFNLGVCGTFGAYADAAAQLSTTVTPTETNFTYAGSNGTCYQFQYTYRNRAGLTTTATSGVIEVDSTAPLATSISIATSYRTTTPIVVTVNPGNDPESDMSANSGDYLLEVSSAPYTNDTCGTYLAWADAGVNETPSGTSYTFNGVHGQCYQFRYTSMNRFGLTTTVTSGVTMIDTTPPAGVSASIATGYRTTTSIPITVNPGNDPESAMVTTNAGYQLLVASATLSGNSCGSFGSWTDAGLTPTPSGTNYTYTGSNGTCYKFRYIVTNRAGLTTTVDTGVTMVDTTAPAGVAISIGTGWRTTTGNIALTVNPGSDGESDKQSVVIEYQSAPISNGSCGSWSAWTDAGLSPSLSGTSYNFSPSDATCYQFRVTTTNNAGLTASATTGQTYIDTTAPGGGSVSIPNVTTSAATNYGISVTWNVGSDAQSAIQNATLYVQSAPYDTFGGCGSFGGWSAWQTVTASGSGTYTAPSGACYNFRIDYTNNAGLTSTAYTANNIRIDWTYSWQNDSWAGCTAPTPSWYVGNWGGCSASPSWAYYSTGGCNNSCGYGNQYVYYSCNGYNGSQTRTVYCQTTSGTEYRNVWCLRSDGQTVADAYCGGGKPATSQGCTNNACPAPTPATSQGCTVYCNTSGWSYYSGDIYYYGQQCYDTSGCGDGGK
jgi:hypothetical protein